MLNSSYITNDAALKWKSETGAQHWWFFYSSSKLSNILFCEKKNVIELNVRFVFRRAFCCFIFLAAEVSFVVKNVLLIQFWM